VSTWGMSLSSSRSMRRLARLEGWQRHALALACSAVAVGVVTVVIQLLKPVAPVISLGVLYVFAVLAVAGVFGLGYSVLVSVASMLAFNWFFLPPTGSFTLSDSRNWLVLAVYLTVAVVVSTQATRSRSRADDAEQRERETAVLAELATALLQGGKIADQIDEIGRRVALVLDADSARIELGPPHPAGPHESPLPLAAGSRAVGTVYLPDQANPSLRVRKRFLPALSSLLAVAVDRETLAAQALQAETLRQSDAAKTAVLRAASHDFRTPLTSIHAAVEALEAGSIELSETDRRELMTTIRVETERLIRLVSNLLDLSRIQAEAAAPMQELWTPDALVAQAIAALGGNAGDRIQDQVATTLPPVRVDPTHAQRVLVNLIENALRHSPDGEPVSIRATNTRREVIFRVIDRGPGIPADQLEEIFEPFHAGSDGGGAGLGLAIARGFAEANGGRVWAESQPGQGATFAFALPSEQPPE